MKCIVDKSIVELGITSVVIGVAKNIDPNAKLSDSFLKKQKKMEDWALQCDVDEVLNNPITQGYADLLKSVGRSIKKYPPTVPAFIRNIQRRGSMPHINSVIDIYNVESLHSLLAIGGHDLDKIDGQITFTVAKEAGVWLGVRDGENYKFDDGTKNAIFIIQGNANTSIDLRVEALKRIQSDLAECMPHLEFEIQVIEGER